MAVALPSAELPAERGDAPIHFDDLQFNRLKLGSAGKQSHCGGERAGAEGAVGFEHFARGGDVAESLRGRAMELDGSSQIVDDDRPAEQMLHDGLVFPLKADQIGSRGECECGC